MSLKPNVTNIIKNFKIKHQYPKASLAFCHDYIVFTNLAPNQLFWLNAFVPHSLKALLEPNWVYYVHSNFIQNTVNHTKLQQRVFGGTIIAYQFEQFSFNTGQQAAYVGILPTRSSELTDYHRVNHFPHATRIWLRELIISILYHSVCDICPFEDVDLAQRCKMWKVQCKTTSSVESVVYCQKRIPWSRLYVAMGNVNASDGSISDKVIADYTKDPTRDCIVCAQCIDCANAIVYCRKHRSCKHKSSVIHKFSDETKTSNCIPKIKPCKKLK